MTAHVSRVGAGFVLALIAAIVVVGEARSAQSPSASAPTATLERIAGLLDGTDLAAARTEVSAALRAFPGDAKVQNLAGAIDAQAGIFDAAESHFLTAIRLAPGLTAAYENLGRLYQEHAGVDPSARGKALDVYRRLLAVDPANTEGHYQSAFLLALGGRFMDARVHLDGVPAEIRRSPQALALTAVVLSGADDPPPAEAAASGWIASADRSAPDVLALLPAFDHLKDQALQARLIEALDRQHEAPPPALHRLGRIYIASGRYAEARAVLERAAVPDVTVPVLVDLARAADKGGDHEGALGYLGHARALEPANAQVHFLFGVVCVELNLAAEAYDSLTKALAIEPDNPEFNYVMGGVAMNRRGASYSIPYFEKYRHLKPDDPRGRFVLGAAKYYKGDLDDAILDLQDAATHPETESGARYYLGRIARQQGNMDVARREIEASLALAASNADVWAELGLIDTRQERYADAERDLNKALAIDPDNYLATVNLTALFTRTKDPRKDAQAARLAALQEKRTAKAQDFLRIVEVVP